MVDQAETITISGKVVVGVVTGLLLAAITGMLTLTMWVVEIRSNNFDQADAIKLRSEIISLVPMLTSEVLIRLDHVEEELTELRAYHRSPR